MLALALAALASGVSPAPLGPQPETSQEQPDAQSSALQARVISRGLHARGQWRGNPAFADFNRDGHLDLVVSNRRWDRKTMGDGVFVYLGDGAGGFSEVIAGLDRRLGYGGSAIGDVDKDGFVDIAYSGHDQTPRVYLNQLALDPPTWKCATPDGIPTHTIVADVALGDFDRDGHLDLATVGQFPRQGGLYVWRGEGTGKFAKEPIEVFDAEQHYGSRVEFADVTGDGHVELLVAASAGFRAYGWDPARKRAVGLCEDHPTLQILGAELSLAPFDFDGDGANEIVVAGYKYAGHAPVQIYRRSEGAFAPWGEGLPADESVFDVKVGHLEKDGPPVLFVGGQNGIRAFAMAEPGRFRDLGRIDDSAKLFAIGVADCNRDGRDEVVWIGEGGVRVYEITR